MFKPRAVLGPMCQNIESATQKRAIKARTAIISYQVVMGGLVPPHISRALNLHVDDSKIDRNLLFFKLVRLEGKVCDWSQA